MAAEHLDVLIANDALIGTSTNLDEQTRAVDILNVVEANPGIQSQKLVTVSRIPVKGIRNEGLINNKTLRLPNATRVLDPLMRGNNPKVSLYDRIGVVHDASLQLAGDSYHLKIKDGMIWTNILFHSSFGPDHDLMVWVFKERHPHNGSLRMMITRA